MRPVALIKRVMKLDQFPQATSCYLNDRNYAIKVGQKTIQILKYWFKLTGLIFRIPFLREMIACDLETLLSLTFNKKHSILINLKNLPPKAVNDTWLHPTCGGRAAWGTWNNGSHSNIWAPNTNNWSHGVIWIFRLVFSHVITSPVTSSITWSLANPYQT